MLFVTITQNCLCNVRQPQSVCTQKYGSIPVQLYLWSLNWLFCRIFTSQSDFDFPPSNHSKITKTFLGCIQTGSGPWTVDASPPSLAKDLADFIKTIYHVLPMLSCYPGGTQPRHWHVQAGTHICLLSPGVALWPHLASYLSLRSSGIYTHLCIPLNWFQILD